MERSWKQELHEKVSQLPGPSSEVSWHHQPSSRDSADGAVKPHCHRPLPGDDSQWFLEGACQRRDAVARVCPIPKLKSVIKCCCESGPGGYAIYNWEFLVYRYMIHLMKHKRNKSIKKHYQGFEHCHLEKEDNVDFRNNNFCNRGKSLADMICTSNIISYVWPFEGHIHHEYKEGRMI